VAGQIFYPEEKGSMPESGKMPGGIRAPENMCFGKRRAVVFKNYRLCVIILSILIVW